MITTTRGVRAALQQGFWIERGNHSGYAITDGRRDSRRRVSAKVVRQLEARGEIERDANTSRVGDTWHAVNRYDDEVRVTVPRWTLPEIAAGLRFRANFHRQDNNSRLALRLEELSARIEQPQ